jgi:hypothetical protein
MSDSIPTLNLSEPEDGMVRINSTNFIPEKNVSENKQSMMDSTPINDIMSAPEDPLNPPMMADPRMLQPQMMMQPTPTQTAPSPKKESSNPMNLTDDQMQAVIVAVCTAIAISKPVQEKLASVVPQFLNAQGSRSMVGLASTGIVAGIIFFIISRYQSK